MAPHASTAAWLSDIAAPLVARFGGNLTVSRTENAVCWQFAGQSVVIELRPGNVFEATFIDTQGVDAVSARPAVAAYRSTTTYALSAASSERMATDLVDFFSGVREPKFVFTDAYLR